MKQAHCLLLSFLLFAPFLFSQTASAQNAGSLQYQFQPNQEFRYRLDVRYEVKVSDGIGQDLPVVTKIVFQASVRTVEVGSDDVATLAARVEGFSARTMIDSKEIVSPGLTAGQTVEFKVGSCGLLPGQEALSGSSGLPWNLFLSQAFPDLTRCRYLGQAVFNRKPCAKIGIELVPASFSAQPEKSGAVQARDDSQGKGTLLFSGGHLLSSETQGSVDLGYGVLPHERSNGSTKIALRGAFSSRLSLLP